MDGEKVHSGIIIAPPCTRQYRDISFYSVRLGACEIKTRLPMHDNTCGNDTCGNVRNDDNEILGWFN